MGGDGGLQRTPCISNVSLRRDVSLHYVAEKPDSVGSVSRGSPGQVEAHTDGNGGGGVNVQKSVGDSGLHRTLCTSNVSLRPGSSNQSVSDSDRSDGGGVRKRPAPSLREALMDVDSQWQEPGFVCAVIPTITAAPSHRYSREEVALRQLADRRWGRIIESLTEHGGNQGPYAASFTVRAGLLFKKGEGAVRRWKLVVPNSLRLDVVRMCHDDATAGHEGWQKTWQRVHSRFHLEAAQDYVKQYVAGCAHCQVRKTLRALPTGPLEPIIAPSTPCRMWGLDHLGPLPRTEKGNRYALVAVDYFSKLVVAEAVPDATAATAIDFFWDKILYQFGVPSDTVSDQASIFTGKKWEELMQRLQIRHSFAAAEHQQSNGLVEKHIGTIVDRIAAVAKEQPRRWDKALPAAIFAINSSVQRSTGWPPFQVLTGILPVLPVEGILPCEVELVGEGERIEFRTQIQGQVRRRIVAAQVKQKKYYDQRRRPTLSVLPGDLVVMRRKATKRGLPKKLLPRFVGPFRVVEVLGSNTFKLRICRVVQHGREWGSSKHTLVS